MCKDCVDAGTCNIEDMMDNEQECKWFNPKTRFVYQKEV